MVATEYWLQKKTIGGWSHVTYYTDLEQAKRNFAECSKGNSGYSWRLVSVIVQECKMLEDVVDIEIEQIIKPWSAEPNTANAKWVSKADILEQYPAHAPKSSGWGDTPSGWGNAAGGDPAKAGKLIHGSTKAAFDKIIGHGLAGKIWMINHSTKTKVRVSASEVKLMEEAGYERGGPRTQFR